MSDNIYTYTVVHLEDYMENRRSGLITGPPHPFVFINLMENPDSYVRLIAHTPKALYDLADDLMDLADDLADENADRGIES